MQAKRCDGIRIRVQKLQNLKKVGGKVIKVLKTGLKPAISYGVSCIGLPRKQVAFFRKATSVCLPGKHRGCSTTLRLAIHRSEPLHELIVPPVFAWASAVWDGKFDSSILLSAWKRHLPRVARATSMPHIK